MGTRRQSGGFNIIELLIVIAIILILTSIVVPALMRRDEQARSTALISWMKENKLQETPFRAVVVRKIEEDSAGHSAYEVKVGRLNPEPGGWTVFDEKNIIATGPSNLPAGQKVEVSLSDKKLVIAPR